MNKEKIVNEIMQIIENVGVDEAITPEASLMEDLGLESLQIFEIFEKLEAVFQIKIPGRVLMRVDTVEELAEEIEKIIGRK